jgi:DNA-binding PadR family transcriptional regulator
MGVRESSPTEKEILRPLWKVHILHHANEGPVVGNWLLEELREHGYRVSPGTLYPLLGRMVRIGWLAQRRDRSYRITIAGRQALVEVRTRIPPWLIVGACAGFGGFCLR